MRSILLLAFVAVVAVVVLAERQDDPTHPSYFLSGWTGNTLSKFDIYHMDSGDYLMDWSTLMSPSPNADTRIGGFEFDLSARNYIVARYDSKGNARLWKINVDTTANTSAVITAVILKLWKGQNANSFAAIGRPANMGNTTSLYSYVVNSATMTATPQCKLPVKPTSSPSSFVYHSGKATIYQLAFFGEEGVSFIGWNLLSCKVVTNVSFQSAFLPDESITAIATHPVYNGVLVFTYIASPVPLYVVSLVDPTGSVTVLRRQKRNNPTLYGAVTGVKFSGTKFMILTNKNLSLEWLDVVSWDYFGVYFLFASDFPNPPKSIDLLPAK